MMSALGAMTTEDVRRLLSGKSPVVVLLPVGSVEPHGPHPVIALIDEWQDRDGKVERRDATSNLGGTMRLGAQPCNVKKGSRTPQQAHMPLLAVPYRPSWVEHLILSNRNILADQMEFLVNHLPRNRRPQ